MGILDRILGKKEKESKKAEKKIAPFKAEKRKPFSAEKTPRGKTKKVAKSKKESKIRKVAKKENNIAHQILIEPLMTEKATNLGQLNKYVFKVFPGANKSQVKSAVEDYYGVGVVSVNIVKIHPKKRIQGQTIGWKQGFKKAIVTLQAGDTIGAVEGV